MNRINNNKMLVLIIAFIGTASCFSMIQMHPKTGWREANAPKATVENLSAGQHETLRVPLEITSFAIDKRRDVWVTTSDGHVLRTWQGKWQDVSEIYPKNVPGMPHEAVATHPAARFKFVAVTPYAGDILAIDENGKVYFWSDQY